MNTLFCLSVPSLLLLCVGLGLGVYGAYSTQWLTAACNNTTLHVGLLRVCSSQEDIVEECVWIVGSGGDMNGKLYMLVYSGSAGGHCGRMCVDSRLWW